MNNGENLAMTYDYVIAGMRACGTVLAARLAEDPNVRIAFIRHQV